MPLTVLLVDDEPLARTGLRALLEGDPDVGAIHDARDGQEGVSAIRTIRPDLIFLDVQMPEMDGFEVVRQIGSAEMPAVVFVTAHDQYAIQAFEINAIDYLLKPVTEQRFAKALERVKARLSDTGSGDSRQILYSLESLAAPKRYAKRLAVRASGKVIFVDAEDIDWIEAAENYVQVHTARSGHLLHVTMNALEKSLDPEMFLRIQRSIIVNVGRIKELQPAMHGEYVVTLANGVRLQSGRMYSERLRALADNSF